MYKKIAKIISIAAILLQLVPIWWQFIFYFIVFTFGESIEMLYLETWLKALLQILVLSIPFAILIYVAVRSILISFKKDSAKNWQYISVIMVNILIIIGVLCLIATNGFTLKFA